MSKQNYNPHRVQVRPGTNGHTEFFFTRETGDCTEQHVEAALEFLTMVSPHVALTAMHKLMICMGFEHEEPFTRVQIGAIHEILHHFTNLVAADKQEFVPFWAMTKEDVEREA